MGIIEETTQKGRRGEERKKNYNEDGDWKKIMEKSSEGQHNEHLGDVWEAKGQTLNNVIQMKSISPLLLKLGALIEGN